MKKEQVLNLMDTVGPDLIEEADIQTPARRRFPKAVRAGLIAACLCLALLGTAFAANPEAVANFIHRFTPVQAETRTTEDGVNGYYVRYEPTGYSIDSFSPALLAAGEGRESNFVELKFDTWSEVRAFIGEDIPCFLPDAISDRDGQFQVSLSYDRDKLIRVSVFTFGTAPWAQLHIDTEYYSGDATGTTGWGMVVESESGDSAQVELLDPYSMTNGCQAEIALFTLPAGPDEDPDTVNNTFCYGTFVQDGIQYTVITAGFRYPEEELLAPLYAALDSFS